MTKILEGGVQRAGDRVRITVQLIDAGTDAHLWAESYDRELTAANIFAIQSEVAAAIAGALKTTPDAGEQARVDARCRHRTLKPGRPTSSASSGWRSAPARRSPRPKVTSARRIALDPKFALAWVGLADALALQTVYSGRPQDAGLGEAETGGRPGAGVGPEPGRGLGLCGRHRAAAGCNSSAPNRCCAGQSRSIPITRRRIIG